MKARNAVNKGKKINNRPSPYDPNYIMVREGCSYDAAIEYIKAYKANKATSLDNFIKRHGNDVGKMKYEEWFNNSLKKGWEAAAKNGKSQSKFSVEYYIRKGYIHEEARELALQYQYETSPLHIDYYIKRGKSLDYAKKQIRAIHDKKIGIDSYRTHLQNTTPMTSDEIPQQIKTTRGHCSRSALGDDEFNKRIEKTRKTFESKNLWVPLKDMSDYALYRKEVWRYTNANDLLSLENYDKRALAGVDAGYHLDHNYSISQGYINGVPPELIGSIRNLRMIPWKENVVKQGKCEITEKELYNED